VFVAPLAFVNERFDVASFVRNLLARCGFGYFFPAVNEGIYATREKGETSDSDKREDNFLNGKRRIPFENEYAKNFVLNFYARK